MQKTKTFKVVLFDLFPLTEPMERKLVFGATPGFHCTRVEEH